MHEEHMAGSSYKVLTQQGKLSDLLDTAFSDVSELAEEVGSWAESMESGNLASSDKCQRLREAADTLSNHTEAPDAPEVEIEEEKIDIGDLDVVYSINVPKSRKRSPSRQIRLENAIIMMDNCIGALEEFASEHDDIVDVETFREEIESAKEELEGVEIPGMYG